MLLRHLGDSADHSRIRHSRNASATPGPRPGPGVADVAHRSPPAGHPAADGHARPRTGPGMTENRATRAPSASPTPSGPPTTSLSTRYAPSRVRGDCHAVERPGSTKRSTPTHRHRCALLRHEMERRLPLCGHLVGDFAAHSGPRWAEQMQPAAHDVVLGYLPHVRIRLSRRQFMLGPARRAR